MNNKLKDFQATKKYESGTDKGEKEYIRWQLKQNEKEKAEALAPKTPAKPKKEESSRFGLEPLGKKKKDDWSFEPKSLIGEPKRQSLLESSKSSWAKSASSSMTRLTDLPQKSVKERTSEDKQREKEGLSLLKEKQKEVQKSSLLQNPADKMGQEIKNIPRAISKIPNLLDDYHKASSGDFRTRKSDVPEDWGKETEKALNKALDEGKFPLAKRENSGIVAPYYDLAKNYEAMNKFGHEGADKFFHCKAAYESASRGKWGKKISKLLNISREAGQNLLHNDIKDYSDDWEANSRGWKGAEKKKSLLESCPRNPRDYYK